MWEFKGREDGPRLSANAARRPPGAAAVAIYPERGGQSP